MKVKDVMTSQVKSFSPDSSAKEALDVLRETEISGLPVIDEQGKLIGMLTEKEILAYLLPSYIDKVGSFVYEDNPKAVKKKAALLSGVKVSQVMRKDVLTINEDAALCEVARTMLTQKARRLPVVDKNGRVVGIIARCDILKAITSEIQD